jgi:transcriptional regulator
VYIPEHFRVRDHATATAFMRANPFVILVSSGATLPEAASSEPALPESNGPFASHVPVSIHEAGDQLTIRGHFAKANPHWRYLEQQTQCLTIFHGAHAYVSPSLYAARESVPTWNYGAVHVYGNARVYSAPEQLLGMLHELMGIFEPAYAQQWAELSDTFRERMLSHIVGFEIAVTRVEAKFKLNQNRPKEDQAKVMASLAEAEDTVISGVADLMKEQGLGVKKHE